MNDGPSLRPTLESLLERLRGMEQSRFWQARNRFFDLKYRLGFSRDRGWAPYEVPALQRAMLDSDDLYARWTAANAARPSDMERLRAASRRLVRKPTFSIVLAIDDPGVHLDRALASLHDQVYERWDLIVVTKAHASGKVRAALARSFGAALANVALVEVGGNTSSVLAVADGVAAARGDFLVLFDAEDSFASDALYEYAAALNDDPTIDAIFGDEDLRLSGAERVVPFFKPDWSLDSIRSRNYIGRGAAYRRAVIEEIGGVRGDFGEAAEYDLILRLGERTEAIAHVSRVLYHRARVPAYGELGARAIAESLERTGDRGTVAAVASPYPTYLVRYDLRESALTSIVIPTRDHAEDLDRCLTSVFERTRNAPFEVLVVDNGSKDASALAVIAAWTSRDERVRVLPMPIPFNYSRLNNAAVRESRGKYLLLLNNDTEVLTDDWLEAMMEQAQRPEIGAVGASLLYPDRSVQHGGVVLGIGGVAGHSHRFSEPGSAGYFGTLRAIANYAAVTAACLMVRRESYDLVGGMDESLTVAFNDVDFCLRLRARGLRNVWLPHVVLVHGESKSRGYDVGFMKTKRSIGEERIMLDRYGEIIACDPYYNINLTRRSEDFAIRID